MKSSCWMVVSLDPYSDHQDASGRVLRPQPNQIFNDTTRLVLAEHSFHVDAAKLWNIAPINVTNALTLRMAKKAILEHVLNMPIQSIESPGFLESGTTSNCRDHNSFIHSFHSCIILHLYYFAYDLSIYCYIQVRFLE